MNFILPFILVAIGLALIFYFRNKTKGDITEIKYMKTKSIVELRDMFSQMDANGLGNDYREFVELKGKILSDKLVNTPFSNRDVAYCQAETLQVTQTTEQYKDSNGNYRTRTSKTEIPLSNEKSSQEIGFIDDSTKEPIFIELNATGCKLDIPKTLDRFEPKNNIRNYGYFNSFSGNRFGAETLGFKMLEKTIEANQSLYIIGEAFKVGNTIHIGKPIDSKKPFIVTTKSEEELINNSNQKSLILLIGGIFAIIVGIIILIKSF